jgi:4-amino-4-deoxy-L-arabinose transferase-like glycosyltransferase
VKRLLSGQNMYVAPSVKYVPFLYPPVYFYLSALSISIFKSGFFSLRLVSVIASLVSFSMIFLLVHKETKNWWAAAVSAGLFAATYRITGAWLDIARVDSLFLALYLSFLFIVRREKNFKNALLAGIIISLDILTKQTAIILLVPVLVYLFWENWRYAIYLLASTLLILLVSSILLDLTSDGWYSFYILGLLGQQTEWLPSVFFTFWTNDLLVHFPIAILIIVDYFLGILKKNMPSILSWSSILLGALAASFVSRVKSGGYDNVLLPLFAVIAVLFGLGLDKLSKDVRKTGLFAQTRLDALIFIGCTIQFVLLIYNPFAQIPTPTDLEQGDYLVNLISRVKGDVFIPDHNYLTTMAGKSAFAHHSAIWDVLRGDQKTRASILLEASLNEAVSHQTFDMIILDSDWNFCCKEIDSYYTKAGEVFQTDDGFYPLTGFIRRPTDIYIPNRLEHSISVQP